MSHKLSQGPESAVGPPGAAGGRAVQPAFPSGVQLTGGLLADLEQWAHLTSKLVGTGTVGRARATARPDDGTGKCPSLNQGTQQSAGS